MNLNPIICCLILFCGHSSGISAQKDCTSIQYHGYDYDLVEVGGMCWFAENLKTAQYSNEDPIYRFVNGSRSNCANGHYGHMYEKQAAYDSRGVCPAGWALPLEAEWRFVASLFPSAEPLKSGPIDAAPWDGTNISGLGIQPCGCCSKGWGGDCFRNSGDKGYYWIRTEKGGGTAAVFLSINPYQPEGMRKTQLTFESGVSAAAVRCVRNDLRIGANAPE